MENLPSIIYNTADGKQYEVAFYALEMILAIGFRVRSKRGTQFRIWANQHLKSYMVKGFVMDDERLKTPVPPPMKRWNKKSVKYTPNLTSAEKPTTPKPLMRRISKICAHWNNKSRTKKYNTKKSGALLEKSYRQAIKIIFPLKDTADI